MQILRGRPQRTGRVEGLSVVRKILPGEMPGRAHRARVELRALRELRTQSLSAAARVGREEVGDAHMTAKEFLRRARSVDRRVDEASERVERLRERLEAGRMSRLTGMPRGGSGDWTQTADRLIELEQAVNRRTRELVRWKLAAIDAIRAVEEPRLAEVLELYYIDGFTWEQVAQRMGLDLRWVYRLHGKALMMVRVPEEIDH